MYKDLGLNKTSCSECTSFIFLQENSDVTTMTGLAYFLLILAVTKSIYVLVDCLQEDVHVVVHGKDAGHKSVVVVGIVWTNPNMEVEEH